MLASGRRIFRFDTFGSENLLGRRPSTPQGDRRRKTVVSEAGEPETALSVGLKVDADALPAALRQQLKDGKVDLDDPAITSRFSKLNAVVGVTGLFDKAGGIRSMGIQCALPLNGR
jgi:hypothetical protein